MNIKERKLIVRAISIGLAIMLCLTMFAGVNVFAAKFSGGSGTKADPYIVKTAKDLDAMRDNLAAHYKLGATIDMSSIKNFEPIGTGIMDDNKNNDKDTYNPFTGSFVCDMGADGLPRYAILNLNVYNSIGKDFGYAFGSPNYTGFGEKGNHYLAALFGITEGATLTNIVLLNAKVENTVPGQHGGVGGFDDAERGYTIVKNQVDSTATAGLVGFAKGTTVSGCGVQGKIISTTNQTGGLIGAAESGTSVSNCWSDCEIKGEGYWSNAGFIGRVNLSNVQSCYAKGSLTFTDNHVKAKNSAPTAPAGFIKTISSDSTVSDCYSEVVTKGDLNSFSFSEELGTVSNCYTTGIKQGKSDITSGEEMSSVKNCWIVKQKGANQKYFKAGSEKDITKAFASLKNWDTSGKLPTLKNAYYIKDYKIYKAGVERSGAGAAANNQQGGTQSSTQSATQSSTQSATQSTASTNSQATTDSTASQDGATENTDSTVSGNDTVIDDGTGATDGENAVAGETTTQTVTEEVTGGYIILCLCLAALTVAISASSVITLLKAMKQKKLLSGDAEEEEDDE